MYEEKFKRKRALYAETPRKIKVINCYSPQIISTAALDIN